MSDIATRSLRLAEFLPFQLSVLSNTISQQIAQRYESAFGITIWQWRVIAVLGESEGVTATDITRRTAMDKVAVSRAVASLIERGLVRRAPSQDDGRRSLLALTEGGLEIYDQIAPMALTFEREVLSALSEKEAQLLAELLERLAASVAEDRQLW